jgi:hypothetical protein
LCKRVLAISWVPAISLAAWQLQLPSSTANGVWAATVVGGVIHWHSSSNPGQAPKAGRGRSPHVAVGDSKLRPSPLPFKALPRPHTKLGRGGATAGIELWYRAVVPRRWAVGHPRRAWAGGATRRRRRTAAPRPPPRCGTWGTCGLAPATPQSARAQGRPCGYVRVFVCGCVEWGPACHARAARRPLLGGCKGKQRQ